VKTFLLFDIDGTLLFSDAIDSQCFAHSYEAVFGRPFPSIDWRQYPHVTDHVIFRTVFTAHFQRVATAAERQRFEDHYVAMLAHERTRRPTEFQEVPGAANCWRHLQADERFVLGIATGGWREPAQVKLRHVGIDPIPPYAAYADGMEQRDHILQAAIDLARNDHDITAVVYIGDAIWDVTTTRQMQLPLIGIRQAGDHEVLHREGVKVVLSDYRDLPTFYAAVAQVLAE
jgi:phosphoglycolate phosphatase-like HAD superfamily hydrolase